MYKIENEGKFNLHNYSFELRRNNQGINLISKNGHFLFENTQGNNYIMIVIKENKNDVLFKDAIVRINCPRLLFVINIDDAINQNELHNIIKLFCYVNVVKNENTIESMIDINSTIKKKIGEKSYIFEYNELSMKNKCKTSCFITPWLFGNVYQNGNICWGEETAININNLFNFRKRGDRKKIDILSQIYLLTSAFFRSKFTHDLERVSILKLESFSNTQTVDHIY